jgi:hypothetical protein
MRSNVIAFIQTLIEIYLMMGNRNVSYSILIHTIQPLINLTKNANYTEEYGFFKLLKTSIDNINFEFLKLLYVRQFMERLGMTNSLDNKVINRLVKKKL